MAAERFDWDTTNIPEFTKNAIVAFVGCVRSCSAQEEFLVQEFQTFEDAKCVRDTVRRNLVTLAPDIILPSRTVGGDKGYLVTVKPACKYEPKHCPLFERFAFGGDHMKCLFVQESYQIMIKDILRILSRLITTNVTCELEWKYLYMYGNNEIVKAKFIKFNILSPGVALDEKAMRLKLVNLFKHINDKGGISDGPLYEFALFNNFLSDANMDFTDTALVERNVIFWDKEKRRDFITQLQEVVKYTNCDLYSGETAYAFPRNWENIVNSHPDLSKLNYYNNIIAQEIIDRARRNTSSSSSSIAAASSSSQGSRGLGYLKDALAFVRHAYEHRYQIMAKGTIQFEEIRSQCPDDLVDIFQYYFPVHVICLAKASVITQYRSLERFVPLDSPST